MKLCMLLLPYLVSLVFTIILSSYSRFLTFFIIQSNYYNFLIFTSGKHNAGSAPKAQSIRLPLSSPENEGETSRLKKFNKLINSENTDLGKNINHVMIS